jgi:hypothetical protein
MKINFLQNKRKNKGFVILFSVTISSILLAISLGVANIALKELKFGTSVKESNDAFFAADSGMELALFNDKGSSSVYSGSGTWEFVVSGLGGGGAGCAKVSIVKTLTPNETTIISKGYNSGGATPGSCNPSILSTERELRVLYDNLAI